MTGLSLRKFGSRLALVFAALSLTTIPVSAQIQTVDPNDAIDADLGTPPKVETPTATDIPTDPPIEGDTTVAPGMESTATPATVPPAGDT